MSAPSQPPQRSPLADHITRREFQERIAPLERSINAFVLRSTETLTRLSENQIHLTQRFTEHCEAAEGRDKKIDEAIDALNRYVEVEKAKQSFGAARFAKALALVGLGGTLLSSLYVLVRIFVGLREIGVT